MKTSVALTKIQIVNAERGNYPNTYPEIKIQIGHLYLWNNGNGRIHVHELFQLADYFILREKTMEEGKEVKENWKRAQLW